QVTRIIPQNVSGHDREVAPGPERPSTTRPCRLPEDSARWPEQERFRKGSCSLTTTAAELVNVRMAPGVISSRESSGHTPVRTREHRRTPARVRRERSNPWRAGPRRNPGTRWPASPAIPDGKHMSGGRDRSRFGGFAGE